VRVNEEEERKRKEEASFKLGPTISAGTEENKNHFEEDKRISVRYSNPRPTE
jgi:hypothetical protein